MALVQRLPLAAGGAAKDFTLEDVARCARPVHFELDDPEFAYAGNGSGFFAVEQGEWLLFTAAHVIGPADPRSIRVLPTDGARRWILIDGQSTGRSLLPGDTDLVDVRCFRINTADLQIPDGETMKGVNLEYSPAGLRVGARLLIAGYPGVSRGIDYDLCRIQAIGRTIEARYVGPSPSTRCNEMNLTEIDEIPDLDGFSGSPVFVAGERADVSTIRLAGMMLRGNAGARVGHFVEARVLLKFSRAAIAAPRSQNRDS